MHWQRKKNGYPLDAPVPVRLKTVAERIAHYSAPPNARGCRIWQGGRTGSGYGSISAGNGANGGRQAHRAAYEVATGDKVMPWEHVHHTCHVRPCVEPSHLQKTSAVENGVEMTERRWLYKQLAAFRVELEAVDPDNQLLLSEIPPELPVVE